MLNVKFLILCVSGPVALQHGTGIGDKVIHQVAADPVEHKLEFFIRFAASQENMI